MPSNEGNEPISTGDPVILPDVSTDSGSYPNVTSRFASAVLKAAGAPDYSDYPTVSSRFSLAVQNVIANTANASIRMTERFKSAVMKVLGDLTEPTDDDGGSPK